MEMTRQRQEESLLSQMYIDCPYCKGHGVIKSPLAISVDIQRQIAAVMRRFQGDPGETELQVLVSPSVMERLRNEDEQMLVEMQKRYSGKLTFKSEVARHPESFAILDKNGKVLYAVSESHAV